MRPPGTGQLKGFYYAAQRACAERLIATTFPGSAERLFVWAPKTEISASAATLMCEFEARKGTPDSLPTLEAIANDVEKQYEATSGWA